MKKEVAIIGIGLSKFGDSLSFLFQREKKAWGKKREGAAAPLLCTLSMRHL